MTENAEQTRFDFLVERDDLVIALKWLRDTAIIYRLSAERALWPQENLGSLKVARGREWAEIYRQAADNCDEILNQHKPRRQARSFKDLQRD